MTDLKPVAYRARWILPGDRPPIPDGVVTIGDGRVLAVQKGPDFDVDLGDAILAPGCVNVHAHLDLSNSPRMEGPPKSFADWLKSVVQQRRDQPSMSMAEIREIAEDLCRRGTIALGDIALRGVAEKAAAAASLAGVTFGEIVGHRAKRYVPLIDELQRIPPPLWGRWRVQRAGGGSPTPTRTPPYPPPAAPRRPPPQGGRSFSDELRERLVGFCPHAPYSTSAEVYRAAKEPRCSHWFESPDEMEFLRTGGGPMKDFLESIDAWPKSAPSGKWYADPWAELLGDPSSWLLVHANFVTPADLGHAMRLSNGNPLRIAYCPRTHAAFGFNEYPLEMFLNAGCLVGLGTDSLASNPDLDVFNEAKFVATRFPQVDGERIFRMLTIDGARLLGCDDELGSITSGKSANVLVIQSSQSGSRFDWERFFSEETTVAGWLNEQFLPRCGGGGERSEPVGG